MGAQRDVDDLGVAVEVERVVAALAADAGRLDAAERGAQVSDVLGVDPAHAGVDGVRDAVGALDVVGPHVGRQPVRRRVGQADRLGLVVERAWRPAPGRRSPPGRRACARDVGDDRRLEDSCRRGAAGGARPPARIRAPCSCAPRRCSRSPARGARDGSAGPARCLGSVGSPTRMCRARSATAVTICSYRRLLDEQARAGGAALPVHREDLRQRRVDALLGVGIVKDDDRGLAAQLDSTSASASGRRRR